MKIFTQEGFRFDKTFQILLILLAFFLPVSVALTNVLLALLVLLWSLSGQYKLKFLLISKSKLAQLSIIFYLVHILGMFWSIDLDWGLKILKKMADFLFLLPIMVTITRRKNLEIYLYTFLSSIFLIVLLSILVYLQIIDPFYKATVINPTITMSHVSYNVIIAFAAYLTLYQLIFIKKKALNLNFFLSILFLMITIDMFITAGRTGQILYAFLIILLTFQYLRKNFFKALMISTLFLSFVVTLAYNFSYTFQSRIQDVIDYANNVKDTPPSISQRAHFQKVSLDIFLNNPLIGIGTGSFPKKYNETEKLYGDGYSYPTSNPHNMYLLVGSQLGVMGLIAMLSIFLYQIKFAIKSSGFYRDYGIALPLGYLLIFFAESYLLGHFTTVFFVFFSSIIYAQEQS